MVRASVVVEGEVDAKVPRCVPRLRKVIANLGAVLEVPIAFAGGELRNICAVGSSCTDLLMGEQFVALNWHSMKQCCASVLSCSPRHISSDNRQASLHLMSWPLLCYLLPFVIALHAHASTVTRHEQWLRRSGVRALELRATTSSCAHLPTTLSPTQRLSAMPWFRECIEVGGDDHC